ncbi:hypothetical protein [Mycobacterium hubeiense]|uniref:hypothetical protein n=1 Tax=Mycobacterium hubeiense TaxID=1867256 RepID=UPI000C7F40F5|nr:hypothetical protein [Mycobacterium sp. QGD 101]
MRMPLIGAAAAILWAPIAAALIAVIYRFPVPFGGYASGLDGALTAALASVFYLVLGGVVVLGALGAVAGALLTRRWLTVLAGFAIAVVAALSLALLEYVIGPW